MARHSTQQLFLFISCALSIILIIFECLLEISLNEFIQIYALSFILKTICTVTQKRLATCNIPEKKLLFAQHRIDFKNVNIMKMLLVSICYKMHNKLSFTRKQQFWNKEVIKAFTNIKYLVSDLFIFLLKEYNYTRLLKYIKTCN